MRVKPHLVSATAIFLHESDLVLVPTDQIADNEDSAGLRRKDPESP